MLIGQTFSTTYKPLNGILENYHGRIKEMLAKITANFPEEWDKYLPAVLYAYRILPYRSTGYSPSKLLFGGPTELHCQF